MGPYRLSNKYPRFITVKFPYWDTKAKLLESYWEQPEILIDGTQMNIYPDISAITLEKRKNLRYLTKSYKTLECNTWEFPFKLIIAYASRNYTIRMEQEAKGFQKKIQSENRTGKDIVKAQ